MPIELRCPQCNTGYRVKDELAGKRVGCKECGHQFEVPQTEVSPGGSVIHRHQQREREPELALGDSEAIEAISAHIETHLGEVEGVFHELLSDLVHIDVHWVAPRAERPFHTLVTSGMSDKPMNAPPEFEEYRFAELLICLPPDWPISQEKFQDERIYWPVRWLKFLARFPHEMDTWLFYSHTVPNGEPPEPLAPGTKLCCWVLLNPVLAPEEFAELEVGPDKTVHFLSIVPLYEEEMSFKLEHGIDPLIEKLAEAEVSELLDAGRPNLCRRGWWPFGK